MPIRVEVGARHLRRDQPDAALAGRQPELVDEAVFAVAQRELADRGAEVGGKWSPDAANRGPAAARLGRSVDRERRRMYRQGRCDHAIADSRAARAEASSRAVGSPGALTEAGYDASTIGGPVSLSFPAPRFWGAAALAGDARAERLRLQQLPATGRAGQGGMVRSVEPVSAPRRPDSEHRRHGQGRGQLRAGNADQGDRGAVAYATSIQSTPSSSTTRSRSTNSRRRRAS